MIRLLARRIGMLCGIFGIWQEEKCLKSCLRGALKPKQQPKMVVNVVFGDGGWWLCFSLLLRGCFCGSAVLPQLPPTGAIVFFVPIALLSVGHVMRNEFLPGFSFILHNSKKCQTFWDLLNYWGCLLLHGCGDFYTTKNGHLEFLNKSQYIWLALFTSLIQ